MYYFHFCTFQKRKCPTVLHNFFFGSLECKRFAQQNENFNLILINLIFKFHFILGESEEPDNNQEEAG